MESSKYHSSIMTPESLTVSPQVYSSHKKTLQKRVYRHCRNYLANTLLSLTMGVVIVGVGCIALGHFLGVQDAEHTTTELTGALERLQMENVYLQWRLSQMSKVFFREDENTHVSQPANQESPLNTVEQSEEQPETIAKRMVDEQISVEQSQQKIRADLAVPLKSENSLTELGSLLKTSDLNVRYTDEISAIVCTLQTRLGALKKINPSKLKQFEDIDGKIFEVTTKLTNEIRASSRNFPKLLKKLSKFNERLSNKMCKNLKYFDGNYNACDINVSKVDEEKKYFRGDANIFQWYPETTDEEMSTKTSDKAQTKYKDELVDMRVSDQVDIPVIEDITLDDGVSLTTEPHEETLEQHNKVVRDSNVEYASVPISKIPVRKYPSNNFKKLEKEKNQKRRKEDDIRNANIQKKNQYKQFHKNYINFKKEEEKFKQQKGKMNRQWKKFQGKQVVKIENYGKYIKFKKNYKEGKAELKRKVEEWKYAQRKLNKFDKKKAQIISFESKGNQVGDNWNSAVEKRRAWAAGRHCEGGVCPNVTSQWIHKRAEGREQCRKEERQGEWQFDRARGRQALRRSDDASWLFERSAAREKDRDDARWFFRRNDARHHHRKGFSPDTFAWI